jgi:hypothetical protein
MAFESWQEKNWDPEVGSEEFDKFCQKINHPYKSIKQAVETTGVNTEDVMALLNFPGFDFTLLNYASYVRTVSRFKVRWLLVLTSANRESFQRARRTKPLKR